MNITPKILKGIIEEYVDRIDKTNDPEWVIPSFEKPNKMKCYVNVDKCTAIDFIGGRGLSATELVSKITGIEDHERLETFLIDWVTKRFNASDIHGLLSRNDNRTHKERELTLLADCEIPKDVVSPFTNRQSLQYLRSRKLDDDGIRKYNLLYSPSLKRIIIPFIENGRIVWWQGRTIVNSKLRFTNPKGVKGSMVVFNLDAVTDRAIIVEGPFDAMMVDGQAVAGATASDWQVAKILSKKPKEIIVVPDIDMNKQTGKSPGIAGCLRTLEKFVERGYTSIKVAINKHGKDLNDLGKTASAEVVESAMPLSITLLIELRRLGNCRSQKLEKLL